MKLALMLAAVAVAVSAQEHSTHPPPPDHKCYCSMGVHNIHTHAILFSFHPFYDAECTESAEKLCIEECVEHKDVLEAAGAWGARIPEHFHPGNKTVGDVACENLGRDESRGIIAQLYHSICENPTRWTGTAFHEPLCCDQGHHVRCDY